MKCICFISLNYRDPQVRVVRLYSAIVVQVVVADKMLAAVLTCHQGNVSFDTPEP